ncbi:sensor histidine kinase [Sphingomonas oryzagri]
MTVMQGPIAATGVVRQRPSALWTAFGTLCAIETMVLLVYCGSQIMLGKFPADTLILTGIVMVLGDTLCDLPLLVALIASERLQPRLRWTLMVLGVLVVAIAQSFFDTQARTWTGLRNPVATPFIEGMIHAFPINFYANMMWVGMIAVQQAYYSLRARTDELVAARASERATQLAALRFQLDPHFLFNALNALSSLVVIGRASQAEEMIGRLSGFLRATLGVRDGAMVRLEDEFETIEAYLDVERVRFDDRLETRIALPADLRCAQVPPFLLQPLVENAMKYGVAPARGPVVVEIAAAVQDGELWLTVHDDGEGADGVSGGGGVGLANVRERLALSYGAAARLEAGPETQGGYRALVRLPLIRRAEPVEPAVVLAA